MYSSRLYDRNPLSSYKDMWTKMRINYDKVGMSTERVMAYLQVNHKYTKCYSQLIYKVITPTIVFKTPSAEICHASQKKL